MKRVLSAMLAVALPGTVALSACDVAEETLTGSGDLVTQQLDFRDFDEVTFGSAFEVTITRGGDFEVSVTVDGNVLDRIEASKVGGQLTIAMERSLSLRAATLKASVTMPEVSRIELRGATRGNVSGFASPEPLRIALSGASRLEGEIEAGDADISLSGASRLILEGSGQTLDLSASGASSVDLEEFSVTNAKVRLSGASNATVNVAGTIGPVELSGASRLRYVGDPSLKDLTTSGAGSIGRK